MLMCLKQHAALFSQVALQPGPPICSLCMELFLSLH